MRKILGLTRYAVVVPALASIIGALLLMAQGSMAIISVVIDAIFNHSYLKEVIVGVLTAVDAILLGTVLLVIGYGLYELFVDDLIEVPAWLQVVGFVGVFVDSNRADELVAYGVGAGALVAGLALFAFATRKNKDEPKPTKQAAKK